MNNDWFAFVFFKAKHVKYSLQLTLILLISTWLIFLKIEIFLELQKKLFFIVTRPLPNQIEKLRILFFLRTWPLREGVGQKGLPTKKK